MVTLRFANNHDHRMGSDCGKDLLPMLHDRQFLRLIPIS